METYDPGTAPDPDKWLSLDEDERIHRIASYHRRTKVRLPNPQIHAALHSVVENQLSEGLHTERETVERLQSEGLSCGRVPKRSSKLRPTSRSCGRSRRRRG